MHRTFDQWPDPSRPHYVVMCAYRPHGGGPIRRFTLAWLRFATCSEAYDHVMHRQPAATGRAWCEVWAVPHE